jgi:drug/metabolite transporter (DMT)-like permease
MHAALLTAFLFACSAIFSQRATRIFGSIPANFYRLLGACLILGIIVWIAYPHTLHASLYGWFFLSGLVGFGLGDIALFLAYPRLGSRLTLLIHFCASTIVGALADWLLIGKLLTWKEGLAATLILSGLAVTLLAKQTTPRKGALFSGVCFALLSAVGMGMGTALSNLANEKAAALALTVPGISQAWQRITAGVLIGGIAFLLLKIAQKRMPPEFKAPLEQPKRGCMKVFWLGGTMLFGPVIGVSCYQWAIMETGSSAIVLAVAATSTLIIMPLARWLEKDKPGWQQLIGTLLAVSGIVWLCLLR